MTEHDYSICPDNPDGKHRPKDGWDPEQPAGFVTIECASCGQTTGYPIPPLEDITW